MSPQAELSRSQPMKPVHMRRVASTARIATAIVCLLVAAGCATTPGTSPAGSAPPPARPAADTQAPAPVEVRSLPAPASSGTAPGAAASSASTGATASPVATPAPVMTDRAVDPIRPDDRIDLDSRSAREDLWARLRAGFAMPNLDNDGVRKAEAMYARNPDYVRRMNERGGRYLFHIVEEVQRRRMPTELALLPFVESAFNPEAMSHARASGMWQFMPATGRVFDLKQNVFRDERRDVLASTQAALDYLSKLHQMFGDWHLALAAYNWGEGNVGRAIARNKAAGLPTDYNSLSMPNETRFYIPKLQAIKNIVSRPQAFGLTLPPLENHPYFLAVAISRDIDVEKAAKLSGLSMADFKSLNPQHNRPVILAAGTPQILLPYDNANTFLKALPKHQGQLASWTAWTVPKTMRSVDAAKQAGMSDTEFRDVNRIPPRMLVKAGSTVLVPRSATRQHDVSEHIADNASLALAREAPPTRVVTVKIGKRGETVASVSQRHRVSAAQVAQWNKVSTQAKFAPGSKVVLHLAAAPSRAKASGQSQRSTAKSVRGGRTKVATKSSSGRLTKVAANGSTAKKKQAR